VRRSSRHGSPTVWYHIFQFLRRGNRPDVGYSQGNMAAPFDFPALAWIEGRIRVAEMATWRLIGAGWLGGK
jgi:hypothetical protein